MVEVTGSRVAQDLRVSVRARSHEIFSDAMLTDGGTDVAPTPHEILAASLAACTSITVQMYADRKKWPLKSADVTVRHSKADKTTDANAKSIFDVTVSFQGDLTTEQRTRLLDIANKCPVHKVLTSPIEVKVVLV